MVLSSIAFLEWDLIQIRWTRWKQKSVIQIDLAQKPTSAKKLVHIYVCIQFFFALLSTFSSPLLLSVRDNKNNEQIFAARGQKNGKSLADFQLSGGNVTEINLHKYNMVRASRRHFICTTHTQLYTYVCVNENTHTHTHTPMKHICTKVRIDLRHMHVKCFPRFDTKNVNLKWPLHLRVPTLFNASKYFQHFVTKIS